MWHWSKKSETKYCFQVLVTCIQVLASKLSSNAKFQSSQDLNSRTFRAFSSTLSVFKHIQWPWSFYSKFKHFQGFLKHAMNPARKKPTFRARFTVADIADTTSSSTSRNPPLVWWTDECDTCDVASRCHWRECRTIVRWDLKIRHHVKMHPNKWSAHLTAVWHDQSCVYRHSRCNIIQPWARAVHLYCSAQVDSASHPQWEGKMSIGLRAE